MSCGVLIDREGQAWPEDSPALRRLLMTDRQGDRLNSFLVCNLGYLHIVPRRSSCLVALCERSAHPVAVVGSIQWIVEHCFERVVLSWVGRRHSNQVLLGRNFAIEYLGSCADAWAARAQRFTAELINVGTSAFASRVEKLQKIVKAEMDDQMRYGLLSNLLGAHFVVSRRATATEAFVVDEFGPALRHYNTLIGRLERGMPLTAVQDKAYGQWIARSYDEAAAGQTPVAHYVEATIGAGTPAPARLVYQRLLLPYRRSGQEWLLSSSAVSA